MARAETLNEFYSEFHAAHNSVVSSISSDEVLTRYDKLRVDAEKAFFGAKAPPGSTINLLM